MSLVLLELNEINFDLVKRYIASGEQLPGFEKLLNGCLKNTKSEEKYEQIEPWIQWPSVHTGMSYSEHNIFRLGDIKNFKGDQIFEILERAGYKVGAISPMNASNKLQNPAYFIPDPWTQTFCDSSYINRILYKALKQTVNDNSQSKIELSSLIYLVICFFYFVRPSKYIKMLSYLCKAIKKPWRKAIFLDLFLSEVHLSLNSRHRPNFSVLFLNAGAHIQHHYFLNSPNTQTNIKKNPKWYIDSKYDPTLEVFKLYSEIILETLNNFSDAIIATGLTQKPYLDPIYYYRLKDHQTFLNSIGMKFTNVIPRMTRDFLIEFKSKEDAEKAEKILREAKVNNYRFFGEIENRGNELFVVLDYPHEINFKTKLSIDGKIIDASDLVVFVAIKNGEHSSNGYAYFSKNLEDIAPNDNEHVSKIFSTISSHFGISV